MYIQYPSSKRPTSSSARRRKSVNTPFTASTGHAQPTARAKRRDPPSWFQLLPSSCEVTKRAPAASDPLGAPRGRMCRPSSSSLQPAIPIERSDSHEVEHGIERSGRHARGWIEREHVGCRAAPDREVVCRRRKPRLDPAAIGFDTRANRSRPFSKVPIRRAVVDDPRAHRTSGRMLDEVVESHHRTSFARRV